MNSSADSAAREASKRSTTARSRPKLSSSFSFNGSGVRRKWGRSGWKNSRGCGSNRTTPAGPPDFAACSRATASSAWWPRCTPSKLPMASAARRAEAGTLSMPWRTCMGEAIADWRRQVKVA